MHRFHKDVFRTATVHFFSKKTFNLEFYLEDQNESFFFENSCTLLKESVLETQSMSYINCSIRSEGKSSFSRTNISGTNVRNIRAIKS